MIIVPARLESSRFPRKMLSDVLGLPLVVRSAFVAMEVDDVVVATDSKEIMEACKKHNVECVMTSAMHTSGTDRCAEVVELLGLSPDEVIINMQGDEPFLESEILSNLKQATLKSPAFMTTCAKAIHEDMENENLVKVVLDKNDDALYFSRSKIPFNRDNASCIYYGHLGVYGFRAKNLLEFCAFDKSPLEDIEKLEQLRALWYAKKIHVLIVESKSIGIDTMEDMHLAIRRFG